MAVPCSACPKLLAATPFDCRADSSGGTDQPSYGRFPARFKSVRNGTGSFLGGGGGISSMILRFPPNFVHKLSTKARRNCSNIGVAQIVAASWSDNPTAGNPSAAAAATNAAAAATTSVAPAATSLF